MELAEKCRVAVAVAGVFLGLQRLFWQGGGTHASAGKGAFRPKLLTRDNQ